LPYRTDDISGFLPKTSKRGFRKEVFMAVSGKYGKVNIPNIGEDEPVFILRAQDKLAEAAMVMYQALAASHGAEAAKGVETELEVFRKWEGGKKLPD
jgi:hypothetical protein